MSGEIRDLVLEAEAEYAVAKATRQAAEHVEAEQRAKLGALYDRWLREHYAQRAARNAGADR